MQQAPVGVLPGQTQVRHQQRKIVPRHSGTQATIE